MTPHEVVNAERHVVDTDLHCPICEYNLTGLTEHRCPECGTPFLPHAIHGFLGEPQPATPWDMRGGPFGFAHTWFLAMFHPWHIGRRFPKWHDERRAVVYSRWCYLLAVALFFAGGFVTMDVDAAGRFRPSPLHLCFMAVWGLTAVILSELLATACIDAILPDPKLPDSARYRLGLTHYASGFAIPLAMAGVIDASAPRDWFGVAIDVPGSLAITVCVLLWWMLSLTIMNTRRVGGWRSRCVLPVIVIAALGGWMAAGLISAMFYLLSSSLMPLFGAT